MPVIECARCGRKTNTALSDHINRHDNKADRCYVRLDERGQLETGCAWWDAPEHVIQWARGQTIRHLTACYSEEERHEQ